MKRLLLICLILLSPVAQAQNTPSILNPSGLPVPRYVSLRSNEVNVRVGPGTRYPIRYIYRRAHLPVQIIEEFAHWRKIADYEGSSGWVHKNMLDGRRTAMILGKTQNLYRTPSADAATSLRAQPLVIGDLKICQPDWCQIEIAKRSGWIRKVDIWGVAREEVFKD